MKLVPLICAHCLKPQSVPRAAANFWHDNEDIPYVCSACTRQRIHQAVVDSAVAKLQAATRVYQIITAP